MLSNDVLGFPKAHKVFEKTSKYWLLTIGYLVYVCWISLKTCSKADTLVPSRFRYALFDDVLGFLKAPNSFEKTSRYWLLSIGYLTYLCWPCRRTCLKENVEKEKVDEA